MDVDPVSHKRHATDHPDAKSSKQARNVFTGMTLYNRAQFGDDIRALMSQRTGSTEMVLALLDDNTFICGSLPLQCWLKRQNWDHNSVDVDIMALDIGANHDRIREILKETPDVPAIEEQTRYPIYTTVIKKDRVDIILSKAKTIHESLLTFDYDICRLAWRGGDALYAASPDIIPRLDMRHPLVTFSFVDNPDDLKNARRWVRAITRAEKYTIRGFRIQCDGCEIDRLPTYCCWVCLDKMIPKTSLLPTSVVKLIAEFGQIMLTPDLCNRSSKYASDDWSNHRIQSTVRDDHTPQDWYDYQRVPNGCYVITQEPKIDA